MSGERLPLATVLYVEYESLDEDTRYLMEVSGREDSVEREKARPRERVLETRLIFGGDAGDGIDVSFNWINESDPDAGTTWFGYAAGVNYRPFEEWEGDPRDVVFGLEMFGGLGDSNRGITFGADVTRHYLSPNVLVRVSGTLMVRLGGAIGLTDVSQDLARFAVGLEF